MTDRTSAQAPPAGGGGTAPVALFVYRRPDHTRRLLDSLRRNALAPDSVLYVFSDGAARTDDVPAVQAVREQLRQLDGFAQVVLMEREGNVGCADNIIRGVGQVLEAHDSVIVVEDDLVLAPDFLAFMNAGLRAYRDRPEIFSVSAASPPPREMPLPADYPWDVYLAPRTSPWGWGTWRDRWDAVDWRMPDYPRFRFNPVLRRRLTRGGNDLGSMLDDQMAGRIDAWDVRFNYAQIMAGRFSLYPRFSYVVNAGLDGSGTHCRAADRYQVDLADAQMVPEMPADLAPDARILKAVRHYHDEHPVSWLLGTIPGVRWLVRGVKKRLGMDRPLLKRRG